MKRVSLALLGALGMLYGKCGLIPPLLKSYQYGSRTISATSAPNGNATGICSFGALSMHEFNFDIQNIDAKFEATGLDVVQIIMTGSTIKLASITSSQANAYAISASENLTIKLRPNYALWGKTDSKISAQSIQGQNNAYGLYAKKDILINGGGSIYLNSLNALSQNVYGVVGEDIVIENFSLRFGTLTSGDTAVGLSAYSLSTNEDVVISFDSIVANNDAYGARFTSTLYTGDLTLSFGNITSKSATAIGLELKNGIEKNHHSSSFESSSMLSFSEISGVNAVGIYDAGSGRIDLREEQHIVKFGKITASSGTAVGFYSGANYSSTLTLEGDVMDFGNISSAQGDAYGFYAIDRKIDIKLRDSVLSLSVQGKNALAFKAEGKNGEIGIDLSNSTLNLNGDGGNLEYLYSSGKSLVDLSGESHHALKDRTSSRVLSIKTLDSGYTLIPNSTLTFKLYHSVDKGIADHIEIEDVRSYDGSVVLDVYYEESTKSRGNRYNSLLQSSDTSLIVNGLSSSGQVGSSIENEGIEDVKTLIHRYDRGGVSYYYIDTQEKQQRYLNSQAFTPILSGIDAHLGSYFLSSNTLNKRMGELRAQRDSSGVWGKISFGGVEGEYETLENVSFDFGVDFSKSKNGKNYFFGLSATLAPTLSISSNINGSNHYKAGIYGGVYSQSGFFYFTQIQGDFFQTQLAQNQYLKDANLNQWGLSFSNELGYKIDFGEDGGFYFEPRAMVSLGALLPTSYEQGTQDNRRLQGEVEAIFALDSKVGARSGYRFESGWDLYFGGYYSYKGLYGKGIKLKSQSVNGDVLEGLVKNEGIYDSSAILFDLGTHIEIGDRSRLGLDVDFGFGELYHTVYKLNANYRFSF